MKSLYVYLLIVLISTPFVCSAQTQLTPEQTKFLNYRTEPQNLDLCARLNGKVVYFNLAEWASLTNSVKGSLEKLGIVITGEYICNNTFLLALGDKCIGELSYSDVYDKELYHNLPTEEQCEVLSKLNIDELNRNLSAFGGHPLLPTKTDKETYQYWSNESYFPQQYLFQIGRDKFNCGAKVYYSSHRARVRDVYPLPYVPKMEKELNLRKSPQNLDLAVELNGNRYFINPTEWKSLDLNQQFHCNKIGVTFVIGDVKFVYKVFKEPKYYTWYRAMDKFGNSMVNLSQINIMIEFSAELCTLIQLYYHHELVANMGIGYGTWTSAPDQSYNDDSCASYLDFGMGIICSRPKSGELEVVLVESL